MTKYVIAVFLATALVSGAAAETPKDGTADKQGAAAPASRHPATAGKSKRTAKTTRPAKTAGASDTATKQTPFGPVAATSEQPPPRADFAADPFVSAEERGEMVIFRRKTPFGSQVWKKKKSDLTSEEQALLARSKAEPPQTPATTQAPRQATKHATKHATSTRSAETSRPAKEAPPAAPDKR